MKTAQRCRHFDSLSWLAIPNGTDAANAAPPTDSQLEFFEAKVRPLLVQRCYECHSNESVASNGEFLIDSAAGIRKGGTRGPALAPGKPQESLLFRVVTYEDAEMQMPPDQKLTPDAIAILRRWIEMGAPDPRTESASTAVDKSISPFDRYNDPLGVQRPRADDACCR